MKFTLPKLSILLIFSIFINLMASYTYSKPNSVPIPVDNPMSLEKIELGKQLFFDTRLSKNGTVSCSSCHNVMSGGEDNRATSMGIDGKTGSRSAPTVWNAAFQSVMFWDGRAKDLEDQAKGPLTNPIEMGMPNHDFVVQRLKQIPGYVNSFEKVFKSKESLTIDNIAKAIAAYERTLISMNSPYDKFITGNKSALSLEAQKGFETFKSVGCVSCHSGTNFSGPILPQGIAFFQKFPIIPNQDLEQKYNFSADGGRFQVTKNESDRNLFRVPTLRNIALTAPYFHNGAVKDLNEAILVMAKLQLGKDISTNEVNLISSFLKSLTGEFPKQALPQLPPSIGSTVLME